MKRPYWLKLALAPLLLAASLLSAPLGSMEQQRADAVECADPAARLAPVAQVARLPVAPRRVGDSPFQLSLVLAAATGQPELPGATAVVARPRREDFRVPPHCERLPHDAIPPPLLG